MGIPYVLSTPSPVTTAPDRDLTPPRLAAPSPPPTSTGETKAGVSSICRVRSPLSESGNTASPSLNSELPPPSRRYLQAPPISNSTTIQRISLPQTVQGGKDPRMFEEIVKNTLERRLKDKISRSKVGERAGLGVGNGRELILLAALGSARTHKRKRTASLEIEEQSLPKIEIRNAISGRFIGHQRRNSPIITTPRVPILPILDDVKSFIARREQIPPVRSGDHATVVKDYPPTFDSDSDDSDENEECASPLVVRIDLPTSKLSPSSLDPISLLLSTPRGRSVPLPILSANFSPPSLQLSLPPYYGAPKHSLAKKLERTILASAWTTGTSLLFQDSPSIPSCASCCTAEVETERQARGREMLGRLRNSRERR